MAQTLGFYSLDVIFDDNDHPWLIEMNGAGSGFEGFAPAYGEDYIYSVVSAAFDRFVGNRPVHLVSRLVNFGELPAGYLDALTRSEVYAHLIEQAHHGLPHGAAGMSWIRSRRTHPPPPALGHASPLGELTRRDERFQRMLLNVSDPTYLIPSAPFKAPDSSGRMAFRDEYEGLVETVPLNDDSIVWLRCPTLAHARHQPPGVLVIPDYPHEAAINNKFLWGALLDDTLGAYIPANVPIGDRISSAQDVHDLLTRTSTDVFFVKPLVGSRARGISIIHRRDVVEYAARLAELEARDQSWQGPELPLELQGVATLLATHTLRRDLKLLSAFEPSRPVFCKHTGRSHYGCIRALVMVHRAHEQAPLETHYLGAYWRLAALPIESDALQWERIVASKSQGAFCLPVTDHEAERLSSFAHEVMNAYDQRMSSLPANSAGWRAWEEQLWLQRYRERVPVLQKAAAWEHFEHERQETHAAMEDLKRRAHAAGFLRFPVAFAPRGRVAAMGLPYLITESHRILTPTAAAETA